MKSSVAYDRLAGDGDPVVLVHGIGHRRQAWGEVPQRLADKGYDVVVVDLPGHGESPRPTRPDGYSLVSHAEQLERLFRELGLERPHVVGNSLGGRMVLELATRGSVRTALALAPAGFYHPHHLAVVGGTLLLMKGGSYLPVSLHRRLYQHERGRRLLLRSIYRYPERVRVDDAVDDTLNLRSAKGFWPDVAHAIRYRSIDPVTVPTTVAWGAHDRLLLPSQAKVAASRLTARGTEPVTHVTLPDCGHCPQIDHPDLVVEVAEETFARAVAAGPTDGSRSTSPTSA